MEITEREIEKKERRGFRFGFKPDKRFLVATGIAIFVFLFFLLFKRDQEVKIQGVDVGTVRSLFEEQLKAQREMINQLREEIRRLKEEKPPVVEKPRPEPEKEELDLRKLLKQAEKRREERREERLEEIMRRLEEIERMQREETVKPPPFEFQLRFQEREVKKDKPIARDQKQQKKKTAFIPAGSCNFDEKITTHFET